MILFVLSCISLFSIGFHFCIRSKIAGDLAAIFSQIDPNHAGEMVGSVLGVCFLGYGITILVASPLIDALGMGRLMKIAGILMITGTLVVIFADRLVSIGRLYRLMWGGMLTVGIGWGLVDANTNPLVASIYPDDKTHKLNVLHAWWPGGIVLGVLTALALGNFALSWKIQLLMTVIPATVFVVMCFSAKFPLTERAAAGVSFGDMFRELFRRPMFWVWFCCIWLTATAELAPGQWVDLALSRTVGMRGIWLLLYISVLMFIMRHFAGTVVHKLSPAGLLWVSCVLTSAGLWWLSVADGRISGLLGATFWGVGVCYLWPTMLATVNERYPRGGALAIGLMGSGATLAIYFFLPVMGRIYDNAKIAAAGGEEAFAALTGDKLESVLAVASQTSFRSVAFLPAVLIIVFGIIWLYDVKKGVKPEKLQTQEAEPNKIG